MKVEYTVLSVPLQPGGPNEDSVIVSDAGGGRPFFAVVVDGHGNETDEQGRTLFKSTTVARFGRDVARGLNEQFQRFPDPDLFGDHFDAVAVDTDIVYRPLVEGEHEFAQLSVGAVASCVAVTPNRIHLAQAGDCRLYTADPFWLRGFKRLSRDHNGDHPVEIERLRPFLHSGEFCLISLSSRYGFSIESVDAPDRLFRRRGSTYSGGLQPTRTFGDWEFQPAVTHEPECSTIELSAFPPGELFALCSDGGNRLVEAVFVQFRGRTTGVTLDEVADFTRRKLGEDNDDVTIVFFRPTP